MAARQRRMSVDHINRLRGVQLPYSPQKTRVEQLPRAREPKISGNLRVSHPFRCSRWTRMFSRIVNRRCCNHAGVDTELPERFDLLESPKFPGTCGYRTHSAAADGLECFRG